MSGRVENFVACCGAIALGALGLTLIALVVYGALGCGR